MSARQAIYMKPANKDVCDVHGWPDDGLGEKLIEAMRASHGKGGVNVCLPCIDRARADILAKMHGGAS